jgi:hypothetical protein
MIRKDPLTGEAFEPKRSNQKFANRANQIRNNNSKAKVKRDRIGKIQKALWKNYNILSDLMINKISHSVSEDFLHGKGFDFRVNTHLITENRTNYACIYEFMIIMGQNKVTIKRIKND